MTRATKKKHTVVNSGTENLDAELCGKCGAIVPEDQAVYCDGLCKSWYDLSCAKLDKTHYDCLNQIIDKVSWYCDKCDRTVKELLQMKSSQGTEEWSSILNIVLSSVQSNSTLMSELANRLEKVENKDREVNGHLAAVSLEIQSIKEELQSKPRHTNVLEETNMHFNPIATQTSDSESEKVWPKLKSPKGQSVQNQKYGPIPNVNSPIIDKISDQQKLKLRPNISPSKPAKPLQGRPSNNQYTDQRKNTWPSNNTFTVNKENVEPANHQNSPKPRKSPRRTIPTVVGSGQESQILVGEKKAWFHISKLKQGTSVSDVEKFLKQSFTGVSYSVEKLDNKGTFSSFKLGVDFESRDKILDSMAWPKYVTIRRWNFLLKRRVPNQLT